MDSTTLAYISGFLDGDGSIFFQIVRSRKNNFQNPFTIRTSVAFYQKTTHVKILKQLKMWLRAGYIRHRKTGISDYTVVEPHEVRKILESLQPYVILKKEHLELSLTILDRLNQTSREAFLETCRLVDRFGELNYSKKRTITSKVVEEYFRNNPLPP